MPNRLTKRIVEGLQEGEIAWDSELKGFGARRRVKSITYFVKYRTAGGRTGRQRWYVIGKHGSPWTPDTARIEAKKVLHEASTPDDPASKRKAARLASTVSDLWPLYLQRYAKISKKSRSIAEDEALARDYILPEFGQMKINDITRTDVARWHSRLVAKPVRANRALALFRAMLNKAEEWGVRKEGTNPASRIVRNRERPRERYLSAEELARLGDSLTHFDEHKKCPKSATALIRVLALTGLRLGEALSLRWQDIDFKNECIRLPDSKTGAKTVPLSTYAAEVLQELGQSRGAEFVFQGKEPKSALVGIQKIWQRIRSHASLTGVRLHDLRHGFASVAAQAGESLYIIGKILGHRQASTTERYAHISVNPLQSASERTGGVIAAAMKGSPTAEVIPIAPPTIAMQRRSS